MKAHEWILTGAIVVALASPVLGGFGVPVRETGPLVGVTQEIERVNKQNMQTNQKRMEVLKRIDKIKIEKRKTALKMVKFNAIIQHMNLLRKPNPANAALGINNNASDALENQGEGEYKDYVMRAIDFIRTTEDSLQELIDPQARIQIPVWDPPLWMNKMYKVRPDKEPETHTASWRGRMHNLVIKVTAREDKRLLRRSSEALEDMVYSAARAMFPRELMKGFNAEKVVSYLLAKRKIVELSDGVVVRPSAEQDVAYARFANLGSNDKERALFWSDPSVIGGYHPVFGTALNETFMRGAKKVDMDSLVSRGYSSAIDKWNRMQPPEKRIENAFRGYASKVMPGLIIMSERGRLTPGEPPSDEQLREAMGITRTVQLLPSQRINLAKVSAPAGDRVTEPLNGIRFVYPGKMIRAQSGGDQTITVSLAKLEKRLHENQMELVEKRLKEIAKLKRENRLARQYAQQIIDSNYKMDQEARGIEKGMSLEGAIPQITRLRQDIMASVGEYRAVLSELEHWHDKLLQKEWVILEHAIETKRKSIYLLMDNASLRLRTALEGRGTGTI